MIEEKLSWMSIIIQDVLRHHIKNVLFLYYYLFIFICLSVFCFQSFSDSSSKQVLILQALCPLVKHGHVCLICALPVSKQHYAGFSETLWQLMSERIHSVSCHFNMEKHTTPIAYCIINTLFIENYEYS